MREEEEVKKGVLVTSQLMITDLRFLRMVPVSDIPAHTTIMSNPGEMVTQIMGPWGNMLPLKLMSL